MENKLIAKGITTDLNSYTFNGIKDEPIIVITEDGFKYKGELIEDKGEIYQLFKNYLTSCQREMSENHKKDMKKTWYDSTMQFDAYAEMTNKKSFDDYYEETFKQPKKD